MSAYLKAILAEPLRKILNCNSIFIISTLNYTDYFRSHSTAVIVESACITKQGNEKGCHCMSVTRYSGF